MGFVFDASAFSAGVGIGARGVEKFLKKKERDENARAEAATANAKASEDFQLSVVGENKRAEEEVRKSVTATAKAKDAGNWNAYQAGKKNTASIMDSNGRTVQEMSNIAGVPVNHGNFDGVDLANTELYPFEGQNYEIPVGAGKVFDTYNKAKMLKSTDDGALAVMATDGKDATDTVYQRFERFGNNEAEGKDGVNYYSIDGSIGAYSDSDILEATKEGKEVRKTFKPVESKPSLGQERYKQYKKYEANAKAAGIEPDSVDTWTTKQEEQGVLSANLQTGEIISSNAASISGGAKLSEVSDTSTIKKLSNLFNAAGRKIDLISKEDKKELASIENIAELTKTLVSKNVEDVSGFADNILAGISTFTGFDIGSSTVEDAAGVESANKMLGRITAKLMNGSGVLTDKDAIAGQDVVGNLGKSDRAVFAKMGVALDQAISKAEKVKLNYTTNSEYYDFRYGNTIKSLKALNGIIKRGSSAKEEWVKQQSSEVGGVMADEAAIRSILEKNRKRR